MKKALSLFILAVTILSSCQKESTESLTQLTPLTLTTPPARIVVPEVTLEPFSAKFTYKVPDPLNILEKQNIYLRSNAAGVVSYVWNFGNGTKSTLQNPVISYMIHGFYNITLTVTDRNGNTATSTQELSILCNFMGH